MNVQKVAAQAVKWVRDWLGMSPLEWHKSISMGVFEDCRMFVFHNGDQDNPRQVTVYVRKYEGKWWATAADILNPPDIVGEFSVLFSHRDNGADIYPLDNFGQFDLTRYEQIILSPIGRRRGEMKPL